MEKEKSISESKKKFKKFLRWFDFSGESFTFKYKEEDKLSTVSAGIIFIVFYILALLYIINISIPFLQRKLFSLQYYIMNSDDQNENITLRNYSTAFAFGLTDDSDNENSFNVSDLLTLEINFTYRLNGKKIYNDTIKPKKCLKEKFFELKNDSLIWKNIEPLNCLDENDLKKSPQGIYTDRIFSYYEITVKSKYEDNKTHDELIEDYLAKYDCKLQFYYTDIKLYMDDFEEPISYLINSMFLQLNPTLFQKKNIYYMNYHFDNKTDNLNLNFNKNKTEIFTGLSRVEDYAQYKGLNRTFKKYNDISNYAKIYIRADNRKIIIKREYPDIIGFFSEKSSILLGLYWLLCHILALYGREKANHSISKKLFYFEGIESSKFKKFKELKYMIDSSQEIENNNQNKVNNVTTYNIKSSRETSAIRNNNFMRRNTNSTLSIDLEKKEEKLINYISYSLYEMIGKHCCCCSKRKKFGEKINLYNQAKNIIDNKLDIIYYIRNMILFEIINKVQLENKNIINFLSRPIIYLNDFEEKKKESKNEINDKATNFSIDIEDLQDQKKIDEKMNMDPLEVLREYAEDETYKTAYKLNSDILTKNIGKLLKKTDKTNTEIKLIYYLKKQLEGIH